MPDPVAPGLSDGSIAELAMLLTRADEQDRAASRQVESAADQAAARDDAARVQKMEDKVGADLGQALAGGIAQIAGGACGVISGAFAPPEASSTDFNWNAAFRGASEAGPGVGTLAGAPFKVASEGDDASAAEAEAKAQADIRHYGQAHEDTQAAEASIQKIAQGLQQIQQIQNATDLTAATIRG